ncbi:MAG: type II secretion system protein GspM [Kiloniellaceae bacterium]
MNSFSSPWLSRAAAIGLLVSILVIIYAVAIGPLVAAYGSANEAIDQANEMLARYRRIAAQRGALEDRLETLAMRQTESGVYLPGDTDALAAAQLQEIVNSKVESGGGRLRSIQILPARADGQFRRVGVRIQMTGNIAAVARILYAFEAGDTFLFVNNVDISNRQARRRRTGAPQTDPELLIRLDLSGYVRPEVMG